MPPTLICYGDLCTDIFAKTDAFPQPGQDAVVDHLAFMPAGSAANCAVTAARLGVPTMFIGVVGSDLLGAMLVDDLKANHVDVTHLRQVDGTSGATIALVGANGEHTFYSYRGVNGSAAYGLVPPDLIHAGDFLHVSGYSFQAEHSRQTALALIRQAKAVGAPISLDASFHFARQARDQFCTILADLDFIFPNAEEAHLISGMDNPAEAAAIIRALGPKIVVIKQGRAGCTIDTAQGQMFVPAYPVDPVVDTTGAGDAFCGGFLAARLWGWEAANAAQIGHAAAAQVIRQWGGHVGAPTLDDLLRSTTLPDSLKKRIKQGG
ncbi:MAG: carbohydrate kinase family protein [Anaerolineae bacterium]|nr:carbohydrate kinase family protein [Anaerolineae bacterium]